MAGPILAFQREYRFLSNFWIDGPLRVPLRDVLPTVPEHFKAIQTGAVEVHDGALTGLSVEHVFQAAKVGAEQDALLADDQADKMLAILSAEGPAKAKALGKTVSPLVHGWDSYLKYRVMLACLRAKFSPGSELAGDLLATGYRMLVEGNTWGDTTWGAVWGPELMDLTGATVSSGKTWARRENTASGGVGVLVGENWLGRLLMLRRAELDCEVQR